MPDPASVERQKEEYQRALEDQLESFTAALDQQRQEYLDHLHNQAQRQKKEIELAVDQQVKQQEMVLTQEHNRQRLQLSQRIHQQRGILEQKAIHLKAEYAHGKMQEEIAAKQYELQAARQEAERQFAADMQRLQQHGLGQQMHPPLSPGYSACSIHQPFVPGPPGVIKPCGSYMPPPVSALEATASYAPAPSASYTPPPVAGVPAPAGSPWRVTTTTVTQPPPQACPGRPCGYGGA